MRTSLHRGLAGGCALWALGFVAICPPVSAQGVGEVLAGTEAQNTLNSGPVGGGGAAQLALDRAKGVGGAPQGVVPAPAPAPAAPGLPTLGAAAAAVAAGPVGPRITVLTGMRVFDAVTGALLDDAQERLVPEAQKGLYYDDGTHGDVQASDGKFTRIAESRDYLAQSNQRVKEETIQALVAANNMNPLKFYGYTIMSNTRTDAPSRNRAWKLVPNPNGLGSVLQEVPIEKPLQVPSFRATEADKDKKVKDDWSDRFLQEFRKNKDSLLSEFYPIYVPQPPVPPASAPPVGWRPFGGVGTAGALGAGGLAPGT